MRRRAIRGPPDGGGRVLTTIERRAYRGLSAAGFHRISYVVHGAVDAAAARRTVVCVHGLTRNGRDFDALAAAMGASVRTVCPDVVGRGRSDWLADPASYGYPQYLADLTALIARLDVERVDWIGTSMGGLLGMMMAGLPNNPIRRLVVNDVGPFIPAAALQRLAAYVGTDPTFDTVAALEAHLREVHAPFGPLTDTQWRHLADHGTRRRPDGSLGLAYDPGIALAFREQPIEDVDLWPVWDAVACPVLVLRGADSDLLSPDTAHQMTRRGPPADLVEFAGCGHAPALMAADQTELVREWLDA